MKGLVYCNNNLAGFLEKKPGEGYSFTYEEKYFESPDFPSISLTLPKAARKHNSPFLFPFFFGILSEGINKEIQCSLYKIDEADDFTRLLLTAGSDTIGAVTVKPA